MSHNRLLARGTMTSLDDQMRHHHEQLSAAIFESLLVFSNRIYKSPHRSYHSSSSTWYSQPSSSTTTEDDNNDHTHPLAPSSDDVASTHKGIISSPSNAPLKKVNSIDVHYRSATETIWPMTCRQEKCTLQNSMEHPLGWHVQTHTVAVESLLL